MGGLYIVRELIQIKAKILTRLKALRLGGGYSKKLCLSNAYSKIKFPGPLKRKCLGPPGHILFFFCLSTSWDAEFPLGNPIS